MTNISNADYQLKFNSFHIFICIPIILDLIVLRKSPQLHYRMNTILLLLVHNNENSH